MSFQGIVSLSDGRGVGGYSGPQVGAFFGDGTSDGAALHLSFVVDDDGGIVLEVQSDAVFAVKWFPLANNHCWDYLGREGEGDERGGTKGRRKWRGGEGEERRKMIEERRKMIEEEEEEEERGVTKGRRKRRREGSN